MSLAPGSSLSHYTILGPLGAGAMGEVYRARDTKLGREVAIKVLPEEFAADEERLKRFEREAKTLASLNHPNVAQIFGVDQVGDTCFLVLELVPGESLEERLRRGPLPLDEALDVCRQIAEGLEAAHEAGVIHRDLKPANVCLTPEGKVKVLDFGLAKPANESGKGSSTDSVLSTEAGRLLGTPTYMAPEQARGKSIDKRVDIWAFGCVLYECLTAKRAFAGDTLSDVFASVLAQEPDSTSLPSATPPRVHQLLQRCFAKDPHSRLRDIGEARLLLVATSADPEGGAPTVRRPGRTREAIAWALVLLLAIVAGVAWHMRGETPGRQALRLSVALPDGIMLAGGAGNLAISPDGHALVFVGSESAARSGLFVRLLSESAPRFLPNTSGASYPFWSPDSQSIAFFADGKLKRVPAGGGDVDVICSASDGRGGAWSRRGTILFAPSVASCLMSVEASGGTPRAATTLDPAAAGMTHRFPGFLPDGEHFLCMSTLDSNKVENEICIGLLGSTELTPVLRTSRMPVYAEPGYLIFSSGDRIVVQRFDARSLRLEGEAQRLPEEVPDIVNTGDRVVSVSANGTLVVAPPMAANAGDLAWFNRQGEIESTIPAPPGVRKDFKLSPDGTRVAFSMSAETGATDLWMTDLKRASTTRLTFGPPSSQYAVWSPDGKRLAYQSDRGGHWDLCSRPAGSAAEETVLFASPTQFKRPYSWSPDGRTLVFLEIQQDTGADILLLSMDGEPKESVYLQTPSSEWDPSLSPDGRWIAYASNEGSRFEIYVQSFPGPGTKYQVTTSGGNGARWSRDGRELFYVTLDRFLTSVPVTSGESLEFGEPQRLFAVPSYSDYEPGTDAQQILAPARANSLAAESITIVQDWSAGLAQE